MTKATAGAAKARKARAARSKTQPPAKTTPQHPGGKLGLVVERLKTAEGAMLTELAALTGWQRHTVRGALSRLRRRGFAIRLDVIKGRKAYRLEG
jgi:hypothetical protein